MIVRDVFSAVRCDRCGKDSEGHEFTYFHNESDAVENAWESGWHTPENKPHQHYCKDCFIEKEDETIEILAPWPEHIKKLKVFISRISKSWIQSIAEDESGVFFFVIANFIEKDYDRLWIESFLGEKLITIEKLPRRHGGFDGLIKVKP